MTDNFIAFFYRERLLVAVVSMLIMAGGILALSCVLPDACVRLFDLARSGKHDEAAALQQRLVGIAKLVGSMHGIAGLKAAMALEGFEPGFPRRPLLPVKQTQREDLQQIFRIEELAGAKTLVLHCFCTRI